jgi:CBS domain-containing protein
MNRGRELTMLVNEVMTTDVATVTPKTSLKEAAARMLELGISGLPVVDADRVLGVVSETDLLFKERRRPEGSRLLDWLVRRGQDPYALKLEARTVAEAMTAPAVTIPSGSTVTDAATMLLDHGIDRLPVVDSGRLVGIVTRTDLVRAFIRTDDEIAADIRSNVVVRTAWVSPGAVTVFVVGGEVVLEGHVDTQAIAENLVSFTERVPGVVSVESRLSWSERVPA